MKVDEKIIQSIIRRYRSGEKIADLAREYQVSRSSVYRWIFARTEREVKSVTKISQRDFHAMQLELERLRVDNEIFIACHCSRYSSLQEKLNEIDRLKENYTIHALCRVLNVRRSTYYHHALRSPEKTIIELEDEKLRSLISEIFNQSKERFGARKIRTKLLEKNIQVSTRRVSRLMKEMDLVCKQVRLHYWSTTSRKYKYYGNKIKREFTQPEPNLVWVSDITYIRVQNDFYYVCVIIDLFSRRVIAHSVSMNMTEQIVREVFDRAFEFRNHPAGLTFHSDQGAQYTSFLFRTHLRKLGVTMSYSHPGMPLDNAVAESFFACMKREELSHYYYNSLDELEAAVSEYVTFYNESRPHYKLGNKTPLQCEKEFFSQV